MDLEWTGTAASGYTRAMMLSGADRAAAEAVGELCYTNPFTAKRLELERRILGPELVATPALWSRSSLHYRNPNVAGLRARTRELLGAARRALERGHAPSEAERQVYLGLVRYHLFDRFDRELTWLVDDVTQDGAAGKAKTSVRFYKEFRAEAERLYGVRELFPEPLSQLPHLFATSVQVRLAFTLIFRSVLGSSGAAARLRATIWESIFTHDMRHYEQVLYRRMYEIPTLVLGESGTGKELVARAVGLCGYVPFDSKEERFKGPLAGDFRALNLTAMSPTLIESELFGHARGSFTGAEDDREGFFELCTSHGVVFLDEIGELAQEIQVKLLRVLQSRSFERVGDAMPRRFRGRVMAATNRDLEAQLARGGFRADLYYRLCAGVVRTPSLAEQLAEAPDDLRVFVEVVLERVLGGSVHVETERAQALAGDIVEFVRTRGAGYAWPGNVRELEQCVRSFILHRDYAPLSSPHPPPASPVTDLDAALEHADLTASQLIDRYCAVQYRKLDNVSAVARKLDLHRRMVSRRLEKGDEPATGDGP